MRAPHAQANSADGRPIRTLVADDFAAWRNAVIDILAAEDNVAIVGQARNGREALIEVEKLRPDVAVLDVNMPEMDGIEAARRIKARFPSVRVVGLSSSEGPGTIKAMTDAGADAYVTKSAAFLQLVDVIRALYRDAMDEPDDQPEGLGGPK